MNTVLPSIVAFALALTAGMVAHRLAHWVRVPDVVLALVLGVAMGPLGLGMLQQGRLPFDWIMTVGAVLILYEGARRANTAVLAKIWDAVALLSTLGVLISALIMAFLAHLLMGWTLARGLLLGAVLAPTDPASIVSVLHASGARHRLTQLVTLEAATNDATGASLALVLIASGANGTEVRWAGLALTVALRLLVGALVGAACGLGAALAEQRWRTHSGEEQEHGALVLVTAAIMAYALASVLGGSGFFAAYAAGLAERNAGRLWSRPPGPGGVPSLTMLSLGSRTLIFVLLGASVNAKGLAGWPTALLVVAGLMLVARPLSVFVSLLLARQARVSWREMAAVSWVRETGVIPAALASVVAAGGSLAGRFIATVVVLAALVTVLVQGTTTRWWIRRLDVGATARTEVDADASG